MYILLSDNKSDIDEFTSIRCKQDGNDKGGYNNVITTDKKTRST